MIKTLRPWQQEACEKAMKWLLVTKSDRHFLINAAPGAGKTICASVIANELIQKSEIDRVIVIAPRKEVVKQWAEDFRMVSGRYMTKVTARDECVSELHEDICATWAAVQGLLPQLQAVCRSSKVLVICDEHHHAAVQAAWGTGANSAFTDARFVLVLTGTPIRSDGVQSVWMAYDDRGQIDYPEDGTYTLTYGEAVDYGYCRPATFHRHSAKFNVRLKGGESILVASEGDIRIPDSLNGAKEIIKGLQRSIDFSHLVKTPAYTKLGVPDVDGYQGTMVKLASDKLSDLQERMPNVGGLVIAHSIEMAEYFVDLIELIDGERPLLVHSELPNAESKIDQFRKTNKRWLVSVAMISEGVDIKRLRVLIYLPHSHTELYFRQAIGRVVRSGGGEDDTTAHVIIPTLELFDKYAQRVEAEMPSSTAPHSHQNKRRKCPVCMSECALGCTECDCCGHVFPSSPKRQKICEECGAINPVSATKCHACDCSLLPAFDIDLNEALRDGAIARGMVLDEGEVQESEAIAPQIRRAVMQSGDPILIDLFRKVPDENFARLREIFFPK